MTNRQRRWVYFFGDRSEVADEVDKELLGGKGASLAAMSRAGLPVPPGFTIATKCCRRFYENGQCWPQGLEEQVRQHLLRLEEATGRRFGSGSDPLLVSVRSGAAVSMPGMMDTILNCGLHPGLAVEMGDTAAFWRSYLEFVVAFAGVVGQLPPGTFRTADASFSAPPSRETAEAYLRVYEEHTGRSFPVEPWKLLTECIDAVFRSWNSQRAVAYRRHHDIRGLDGTAVNVQAMFPSQVSGILFTQDPNDLPAEQMVLESSYGLGEAVVSGEVTPDRFLVRRHDLQLLRSIAGDKRYAISAVGDGAARAADQVSLSADQVAEMCRLGLQVESKFGAPMDIEWGWAEGKFSLLQCRPIRGLDVARDMEAGRQAEIDRLRSASADHRRIWVQHNLAETLRAPTPLTWDIVRHFMSGDGGFGQLYQDLGYRPSAEVCTGGFLELIGQRVYADPERVAQLFWGRGPMAYDLDALKQAPGLLDRAPTKFDADKADGTFFLRLEGDTTVEQNQSLHRVAQAEIPLEDFLDRYGHRAFHEMELAEPRWREDAEQLEPLLGAMQASGRSPLELHQEHAAERSQVEAALPDVLAEWGGSSLREEIQAKLHQAQSLLGYRESAKHHLMMGYELLRLAILELARRWELGRDVFFLHLDELASFERERARLEESIAGRKLRWQSLQRLDMPDVIDSENLDRLGLPQELEGGDLLEGEAIAAGAAGGTARVVFDPRQTRDLGTDYILVCPSTDPAWTSLFVNARGLVVERGGVLSHGAIVARDFGIPAVVCAGATRRIRDGDRLQIDGNRGTVRILAEEPVDADGTQ